MRNDFFEEEFKKATRTTRKAAIGTLIFVVFAFAAFIFAVAMLANACSEAGGPGGIAAEIQNEYEQKREKK